MTDYSIDIIKDTSYTIELNEQGPQGIQGERGIQGPEGPIGPKGDIGPANTLAVGSVTKGEEAEVTIEGESPNQTINFVLPKGDKGEAATITIGKVETVDPNTSASVINVGTSTDSILDFEIPRGYKGEAATVAVGSTTTSEPGTEANVVNSGDESMAILEFTIPKGEKGDKGDIGEQGPQGEQGAEGPQGPQGLSGISVTGVEQISKVSLVATYRMYFSDGTHFDYEVTDGSVDGVTREQIVSLIGYEPASYTSVEGLTTRVSTLEERVEDLTASKFPNVVIVGTPRIEGGQVSGYSNTNYLQFPFVDISRGLPFDIYFSFTTGSDVVSQQNILDSYFGIALAIQNSKGVMAISSNGTSWDIGNVTGTNTILPNTTYYAKCSWTGTQYNTSLSTNNTTYIPDMVLNSTLTTNKTTIFIGGSPDLFGEGTAHPFKGTINFNKSRVDVQGATVWEGMADVGLASRANVSLNNLDEVGEKRFTDIQTKLDSKQNKGNYALKSEIPTKTSQLTNDSGFITSDSTFVHKTGNETVAGVKTFSSNPIITGTGININNSNDVVIQKQGTNFLRKASNGSVVLSGTNTIYIRPSGDTNTTGQLSVAKDGTVTGTKFVGSLKGDVTGNVSGSSGSCTGNSATATKATQDASGRVFTTTYATKTEAKYTAGTGITITNNVISTSKSTNIHYVTETYVNGTSWYRLYDDNWCEQGGKHTATANANTTITLIKQFNNTDYNLLLTGTYEKASGQYSVQEQSKNSRTTSSFVVRIGGYSNLLNSCYWQACGYIN